MGAHVARALVASLACAAAAASCNLLTGASDLHVVKGAGGAGAGTTHAATGAGGGGGAQAGGGGGSGPGPWPTCASKPAGAKRATIPDVWADDPKTPKPYWLPGVYVTAIAGDGCVADRGCTIFVQQDPTYATILDAAKHGLKVYATPSASKHFTSIAVGDRVDVFGDATRVVDALQNELLIEANMEHPGCMKRVGTGSLTPVEGATFADLTVQAYEQDVGPVLVHVTNAAMSVHGYPRIPTQGFHIYDGTIAGDAGVTEMTLSPLFSAGKAFAGLPTDGMTLVKFTNGVTGVFGLYLQRTPPLKYPMIFVRSDADYTPHAP
ncbi:MAG TPA: hypothetical protein VHB21_23205 [Minicystis sp.]|nr:hypothetical protein [Minicystis sp.]